MADRVEEATGLAEDAERGLGRAKTILAEFVDATRSAAVKIMDDQKRRAAEQVKGIAEAVRCAAQSLERSENRAIARYADRGADQIEDFSHLIGDRPWNEMLGATEDFARRRPMLFVLGAIAAGFLAARLLSLPTDRRRHEKDAAPQASDLSPHRGETDEITAAVSKLATRPNGGDGKIAGYGAELSVRPETRR